MVRVYFNFKRVYSMTSTYTLHVNAYIILYDVLRLYILQFQTSLRTTIFQTSFKQAKFP
jgi:hypothetical protein